MFTTMLMLHVVGAVLAVLAILYGAVSALTRKGNLKRLKATFTSLVLYLTTTGMVLVALQSTTSVLTTFCISGLSLFAAFAAVYYIATLRLEQPETSLE